MWGKRFGLYRCSFGISEMLPLPFAGFDNVLKNIVRLFLKVVEEMV
jgi:hypothetical protein